MNFHKLILIGMFFIVLDLNIDRFDIIPDFIGYFVIANAFSKVDMRESKIGMVAALVAAVLAFGPILYPMEPTGLVILPYSLSLQIFSIVTGLLSLVVYISLFSVSKKIVHEESRFPALFISMEMVIQLWTTFAILLPMEIVETVSIVIIVIGIGIYIYLIWFLSHRKNMEREFYPQKRVIIPQSGEI